MPKPNIGQGDKGKTHLFGSSKKHPKDSIRFEALGALDELNSFIGMACSFIDHDDATEFLRDIQRDIFTVQANIGFDENSESNRGNVPKLSKERVNFLEEKIKEYEKDVPELTNFILPGVDSGAATLHYCRAKSRTAERRLVSLSQELELNSDINAYINRLSDVFFILSRWVNYKNGTEETPWNSSPGS